MSINLMERAAARLDQRHRGWASSPVVYSRGLAQCELQASIGSTAFNRTDASGLAITDEHRDFIVAAADLVLAGERIEPAAGDQVRQIIAGAVHVFEVMAPAGEPVFRYSDPSRITLRIHSKRIDTETEA